MILLTRRGREIYLTDAQAQQVDDMVAEGAEFISLPDGSTIKAAAIEDLRPGGDPSLFGKDVLDPRAIAERSQDPWDIPDEVKAHRREKLQEMKEKFLEQRKEKR